MESDSRVTLHMVSSLDGFIAKHDGNMDWFETNWSTYEKGQKEEDPEEFLKAIDCYILGSHTYEVALQLGWPYGDKPTYVLSNRTLQSGRSSVEFYSGDLGEFVNKILKPKYRSIWLVGGAMLSQEFLRLGLVDDIRLAIIPILLGSGLPFFGNAGIESKLNLKDVNAYKNGMIELWYEV